jgi:uncharacterized membrane protein YcaP (DUF421 family)
MNPSDIKLNDWQRILFGNTSPEFLIEVFLRTLIVYLALLLIVKWLGKRMSGQLTIIEMTVMVTLGAIVSVPMQTPDRGILQGLLILLVAFGLHWGINYLGLLYPRAEEILQGKRVYLEPAGSLSIIEAEKERPGLAVFPPKDEKIIKGRGMPGQQLWVCINCGKTADTNGPQPCENCHEHEFIKAII